jgi:hypothetical protein
MFLQEYSSDSGNLTAQFVIQTMNFILSQLSLNLYNLPKGILGATRFLPLENCLLIHYSF